MADTHNYISDYNILASPYKVGLAMSEDGNRLFYISQSSPYNTIVEARLSTSWDITTATTYTSLSTTSTSNCGAVYYADDISCIIAPYYNDTRIRKVSIASGLSSWSVLQDVDFPSSGGGGYVGNCWFGDDGRKMLIGYQNSRLALFDLSSAWDLTTASRVLEISFGSTFNRVWASRNGRLIIGVSTAYARIYRLKLNSDWDLSDVNLSDYATITATAPRGVFCKQPEEDVVFVTGTLPGENNIVAYTITPTDYEFWTNFKGQSEILT